MHLRGRGRPAWIVRLAGCGAAAAIVLSGCATGGSSPTAESDGAAPPGPAVPTSASAAASAPPSSPPPRADPSAPRPIRVSADSIGLDEPLIELGLDPAGAAEVPVDYDDAGWFAAGGRPGGIGPTVLLGHVDSRAGPAVFFRLREMRTGDEVLVETSDGSIARYVVVDVSVYSKDSFPTFEVYGATLDDVLRLVTCGGEFDPSQSRYLDNVEVTAARA